MSKRKPPPVMGKKKEQPFNNPFVKAKSTLREQVAEDMKKRITPPPPPPPPPPKSAEPEDENWFLRAMTGAKPIDADPRGERTVPRVPPDVDELPIHNEEAEALAELASLVDGTGQFDISDSDEFIEGCAEGLDRRVLRRLRAGDYAVHGHLDLHGLTREPARAAVEQFIADSRVRSRRCVLIVHGRGLNSKDNVPILKNLLRSWLERGRIGRSILAFCTARPHDGGTGAVYVLLRK